jgi:hypothetical protein
VKRRRTVEPGTRETYAAKKKSTAASSGRAKHWLIDIEKLGKPGCPEGQVSRVARIITKVQLYIGTKVHVLPVPVKRKNKPDYRVSHMEAVHSASAMIWMFLF